MGEVHIKRDFSIPAAFQFKNPGAMWPGAIATKWHSTKWQYLSDGTGQGGGGKGNKIAIFDRWVDGMAAQLDLWRTSPKYKNKRFADAIRVWSGGNNVPSYITFVKARVPGITENTIMNDTFWKSAMGPAFLKAQAWHEAGRPVPAPAEDWIEAQKRVFNEQANKRTAVALVGGAVEATASSIGVAQAAPETHWTVYGGIGLGTIFIVAIIIYFIHRGKPK